MNTENEARRASDGDKAVLIAINGIKLDIFIQFSDWLYGHAKYPCDADDDEGRWWSS